MAVGKKERRPLRMVQDGQQKNYTISIIRAISTVMVVVLHIAQNTKIYYAPLVFIQDWFNIGLVMFFQCLLFCIQKG